jgi:hypothetical protein
MSEDIIIQGRDGTRRHARKGEMLQDGERFIVPVTLMDAQARAVRDALAAKYGGFVDHFADGSVDHTSPHRPGYRFLDTNDPARVASEEAYRARSARMQDAWKTNKGTKVEKQETLDQSRAAAAAAYEARNERLRNGWRRKDA